MIRYRPNYDNLTASIKDEELFRTKEEMLSFLADVVHRAVAFIGAESPSRRDEIIISQECERNYRTGYNNEHKILVLSTTGSVCRRPVCIGYCDLEG